MPHQGVTWHLNWCGVFTKLQLVFKARVPQSQTCQTCAQNKTACFPYSCSSHVQQRSLRVPTDRVSGEVSSTSSKCLSSTVKSLSNMTSKYQTVNKVLPKSNLDINLSSRKSNSLSSVCSLNPTHRHPHVL